jgi:uncharacterized repeat protein (TIGR01451 family)
MVGIYTIVGILLTSALFMISSAEISVDSHDVRPGGTAVFTINVSNTGETPLNPVKVIDALPKGMSYVADDRIPKGHPDENKVTWPNIGPIDIGESTAIHLLTKIDHGATGRLTNNVSVIGSPVPDGYDVISFDEEYVDIERPRSTRTMQKREDRIIGDKLALANHNGQAANNIKIVVDQ